MDSIGVSSARVVLNDQTVFAPKDFHNKDFTETRPVNLIVGTNTLEISFTLRGSPGDQLTVTILDCDEPPHTLWQRVLRRTTGKPVTIKDDIDVSP